MNRSVNLQNEFVSLRVVPALGGKIDSLIDRRTGREWLWANPHLVQRSPRYGESYVENIDYGGWDEIYPSVSPVRLADGTQIPDHGEVVGLPAQVTQTGDHSVTIVTQTRSFSTRFSRIFELVGACVQVHYSLVSHHPTVVPYLWAAHPLIALEQGMKLELPIGQFVDAEKLPFTITSRPRGGGVIDLFDPHCESSPLPVAHKCFTKKGSCDEVTVRALDGSSLTFSWDAFEAPYLGLWINLRGWSGSGSPPYFNLGIEPTTAPQDDLLAAIDCGQERLLCPGKNHHWSLRVDLSDSVEGLEITP